MLNIYIIFLATSNLDFTEKKQNNEVMNNMQFYYLGACKPNEYHMLLIKSAVSPVRESSVCSMPRINFILIQIYISTSK